jgi:Glutaredoxin-like domain (DUF836)
MRAALESFLAQFVMPAATGAGAPSIDVIDVDIDADPALEAHYNEAVPVLMCDGAELCRYHFDEARVRAALVAQTVAQTDVQIDAQTDVQTDVQRRADTPDPRDTSANPPAGTPFRLK